MRTPLRWSSMYLSYLESVPLKVLDLTFVLFRLLEI